jgi:L,D-peptidoglycan transpeptidase YkuD (ErfK/YbiS/YcfS/YnhG family)
VGVYGGRDDCGYGHCVVVKTNAQMMDGGHMSSEFFHLLFVL